MHSIYVVVFVSFQALPEDEFRSICRFVLIIMIMYEGNKVIDQESPKCECVKRTRATGRGRGSAVRIRLTPPSFLPATFTGGGAAGRAEAAARRRQRSSR